MLIKSRKVRKPVRKESKADMLGMGRGGMERRGSGKKGSCLRISNVGLGQNDKFI